MVLELARMVENVAAVEDQESEAVKVSQQRLLEIRGFLNYVVRTYDWLSHYTKGLSNSFLIKTRDDGN